MFSSFSRIKNEYKYCLNSISMSIEFECDEAHYLPIYKLGSGYE